MFSKFIILMLVAWVVGGYLFFTGPAKKANQYMEQLSAAVGSREDYVLLQQLYLNKQPRNVVTAWLLVFLTPTISYIYQAEWVKALLTFFTLQGFGAWWLISYFTMPHEVLNHNKRLADQAYAELRLARPGSMTPPHPPTAGPAWTQPEQPNG